MSSGAINPIQHHDRLSHVGDPLKKKMPVLLKAWTGRMLNLPELENLYRQICSSSGTKQFSDKLLEALGVSYHIEPEDLRRIPESGPVVVVANHPFGAIEGLVLLSILQTTRTDVKILANDILKPVAELQARFIYVDGFGGMDAVRHNYRPLREAIQWINQGGVLAVFPAGEVSHLQVRRIAIADPPWNQKITRMVRKAEAPVLPVYFRGSNGLVFQMLGLVHRRMRTALLVREMLNKRDRTLEVRIGNLVPPQRLWDFATDSQATDYLRRRTYLLEHRVPRSENVSGTSLPPVAHRHNYAPVEDGEEAEILETEIRQLAADNILIDRRECLVACANAWEIPHILSEIGRQREMAFRAVMEGSGKSRDLDLFDEHYLHLFLWNRDKKQVQGAYRIGRTDEIMRRLGPEGLYVNALFRLSPGFFQTVGPALELGRSFVRPEYQRDNKSLQLLWSGLARYVSKHMRYRYLYGPVSISNDYSPMSQHLLVSFLKRRHPFDSLRAEVKPLRPPSYLSAEARSARALCKDVRSLEEISDLVSEIEPDSKGVPVLLRHYARLGARALGFNIDPAFSSVLDALMVIDLAQVDKRVLQRMMGKPESTYFCLYHGSHVRSTGNGQISN
jgi:putative hemolysin